MKTLIFIPTYNERENAEQMFRELQALRLDADILFLDDHSPDGTGAILDQLARQHDRLKVIHRPGKLGIGSAHATGIAWAYAQGYHRLVTMDCDFTHSPQDLPRLLKYAGQYDVVVGSRYLQKGSLPGWNPFRRFLTHLGHFLTRRLLGMPYDATGAFRVYNLEKIPPYFFGNVASRGYSFFFESLFLLTRSGFAVHEVPITLPARTYGHSKMSLREASRSLLRVLHLFIETSLNPNQFRVRAPFAAIDPTLVDPQNWDQYWENKKRASTLIYDIIATIYRYWFIRRRLTHFIRKHFSRGALLLHAGCGSGQVDADIQKEMQIVAVDISVQALNLYQGNNPGAHAIKHVDILRLSWNGPTFDGIYNLGVMEHFTATEIQNILGEFRRVLKREGKLVLFWPCARASSVYVLRFLHWVLNDVLQRNVRLHPAEISLLKSRSMAKQLLREAGFTIVDYDFGFKDMFVQAVIVAQVR